MKRKFTKRLLFSQKGLEKIDTNLKDIYKEDGAPDARQLKIYMQVI